MEDIKKQQIRERDRKPELYSHFSIFVTTSPRYQVILVCLGWIPIIDYSLSTCVDPPP